MLKIISIILVSLLLLTGSIFAGVPNLINYRGNLVESGTPVNETNVQINFQLYDAPTGIGILWESGNQSIDIINGAFSYTLGLDNSSTFSNIDWKNKKVYLQIIIKGQTLTPRERIGSVGYALVAQEAAFVKSSNVDIGGGSKLSDWETNTGMIKGSKVSGIVNASGDAHSMDAVDGSPIDVVYVDANGNVGIGTNNPIEQLYVNGNVIASNVFLPEYAQIHCETSDTGVGTSWSDIDNLVLTDNISAKGISLNADTINIEFSSLGVYLVNYVAGFRCSNNDSPYCAVRVIKNATEIKASYGGNRIYHYASTPIVGTFLVVVLNTTDQIKFQHSVSLSMGEFEVPNGGEADPVTRNNFSSTIVKIANIE